MNRLRYLPQGAAPTDADGFEAFDLCHRQTLFALGKLAALVSRLANIGLDAEARALAGEVHCHFSDTVRQHHRDEERYVFPRLASSADAQTALVVSQLVLDHAWLEEDWVELLPHIVAIASGQAHYHYDLLRANADVFSTLSRDHIALEESVIYPQARQRCAPAYGALMSAPGEASPL